MPETLLQFLEQFITDDRLRRFNEVLDFRTRHVTVVLEDIYHPHNASACLRTCDCFGIQDVHVVESCNRFKPKRDIAMGSARWLTIHRYATESASGDTGNNSEVASQNKTSECLLRLKKSGYRIIATSPLTSSTPLTEIRFDSPTAVVFGAENSGVSDEIIQQADQLVHIPMFGFTESFNISVSLALLLQHAVSFLHSSTLPWRLTNEERFKLREAWVQYTLGHKYPALVQRFDTMQSERKLPHSSPEKA